MVPLPTPSTGPQGIFSACQLPPLDCLAHLPSCLLSTGAGATGLRTGCPQVAPGMFHSTPSAPAASELTTVIFRAGGLAWGCSQGQVLNNLDILIGGSGAMEGSSLNS